MGTKGADTETAKGRWAGDQTTEGQIRGEQRGRWETNRGRWRRQNDPERVTQVGGDRQAGRRKAHSLGNTVLQAFSVLFIFHRMKQVNTCSLWQHYTATFLFG